MSQAVVDPNELRRFAHNLKRFGEDLQMSMAGLHGQMLTLSETWRDQEHAKFWYRLCRWRPRFGRYDPPAEPVEHGDTGISH